MKTEKVTVQLIVAADGAVREGYGHSELQMAANLPDSRNRMAQQ